MKILPFILSCLFIVSHSFAQSNDLPIRSAYKFKLAIDKKSFHQTSVKSSPYILKGGSIQIYPGEKVFIEIERIGDEIKSMKSVRENLNPEKTLRILFFQQATDRENDFMYLNIINPFNKNLKYKAYIFLPVQHKQVETVVDVIQANNETQEAWPHPIEAIALSGWKFVK